MAKRRSKKPYIMTIDDIGKVTFIDYPTYKDLVKDLKNALATFEQNCRRSYEDVAQRGYMGVYRSRRAEWGEWFEHWKLENGVPVKIKEGWM